MQQEEETRQVDESNTVTDRYPTGTNLGIPVDESDVSTIITYNSDIFTSTLDPNFNRNFEVS